MQYKVTWRFATTAAHNREQQNYGKPVVEGKCKNRGGGYGLEIPWECHFTGEISHPVVELKA